MKKKQHLITIRGAKGKGGGGSTFEADDNMFARQSAAFIDAIAEGPIKGLVYGDASILVDEVRLRNVDQSTGRVGSATNFNNFTVITKNGEATQVVDADFFAEYPSASFMQSVGSAELLENEPQYHTISSGTFEKRETDYIKVTISTTGMSAITKKGDNKGDIKTTVVYFTIDFNWVDNSGVHHTKQMFDTGFNGKVSGKYAHTFGFNIETIKTTSTINDWSVKVKKLTSSPQSSDSVEVQNAIFVDTIEASIADKLEYPYTAYVGGVIDAEAFSSVPARGYEIDGKLIQIPSNHYPLDYNGRKLVLSNASAFAVGDVIGQTLSVSALNAAGTPEEGYTATASVAAHGVAVGETFKVTIATSSSTDEEFWEGTFAATATTTTAFTYTLNKPFNETTGEYKTLSGLVCGGTKTAAMFSGGLVEKKVSNTLYLRNVAAQSSAVTGTITNQDEDSGTVTSSEQVFIPANYRRNASTEKPTTLEQDWDGTFYQSWCNNPAWVFNDLVTNKIYGLGNYLTQAQVNKWELFQIGRYCDELVPAGVGAADLLSIHCTEDANYLDSGASGQHEPRFSANLVISGKQEAYKVLNDVTSIFRGMTYWLNGEAYLVQDSEKDPVYQFTNANVINGEFKYEGTANKTRTNSIMVNWNNPQDYYRSRTEIVELEENLQKDEEFLKPDETTAFGCTSRGQARRLGKWKLLTNSLNTNTVAFTTSVNAVFLRPGDIVQVLDQHKEGKSWGGRVSSSSSTSALNIDRKPTSFGNTSVESGYAAGDYRVTCSFVGYKAILAQDTATIGSTAYVRGAHLSSITTEEAAARQQDDSGDLVFVQWTPFTFTETETLQSVSNSGKTLTVASAFSVAPTHESIWVISRAAQATGKTKLEAKLFRVMSIAETDRNMFEVTGLEYNASKFDAVDKNEALTEYRTIYLPDSFKDVPAVTNIDAEPIIRAGLVDDSNINLISIEWDPATNSDGSLYSSLREYQVEYSTDNEKWTGVGSTPNTSIDLMGNEFGAVVSGQYYFRVYTINLNGKRSPYTDSGVITIDFNRAVGPSEGTVGNANWTINKIGNVSGDFSLDSGKVTFSPSNLFHNDGKNEHAVTNQAQLDFTGLTGSNTDNNGANTGYVYFDHTASAFIAISHDEVSDQFYVPGASVFATATGTLTASTSATPKKWTGLDSTNFDGELAVDNVFKFTKNSTDYYHRVKRFDSDSVLHTYQPTRFTLIDSGNQAFSKPNFLADFNNDTIMGKVVKDGSGNYTLQKFGASQGESAFEVHGSNENFTFDANLNGEVTNESAFGCSFTVQKGTQAYAFAASGTAINTFGISLQARTGFDNESDIEISSTGVVTVGNGDMDAHTSATATLRLFDRGRASLLIADKILSFTKTAQGTAGENAKIVVVTPSNPFFVQFSFAEGHVGGESGHGPGGGDSLITNPAFITISAATSNTTANGVWSTSAGTLTNIVNTHTDPSCRVTVANAVDGMTVTYTLASADGGAADFTTLEILTEMEGLITPYLTNEAHVYPASKTGIVSDITGSGTNVEVYEGGDRLDYDGTGTARGKWKVVLNSPTGLSKGGVTSSGSVPSRIAVVANHTPETDTDNYSLVYTISGKTSKNVAFSFTKVQSLTKSKTGEDGSAGDGLTIAYLNATSPPNAPPTGSADATPGSWTATPSTPASGYKTYVSFGTRTNNTGNFTWSTPSPITARDGDDGAGTEYIFAITANSSTSPSAPSNSWGFDQPQSPWYDGAPSVTTTNKALWRAQRNVVGNPSVGDAVSANWSGSTVVGRFGDDGAPAVNSRYPTLYRLNSSTRVAGNGSFADPRAGNTDWNYAVPSMTANGHEVYAMSRIFTSDGNSPHESAWPAAALYAKRVDGVTVVGVGTRQVNLYKKNDSSLSNNAFGSFADPKATVGENAIESGWDYDVPTLSSNTDKVYVITRIFTSDGNSPQTANWTAPVIYAQRTDGGPGPTGPSGASSHVAYYLQSGYNPPATPSPGTDTTPGSYIATIPTAAVGKSIWYINGTTPANSSTITWTAPQFYLGDFDFTLPGIFDNEFNLNLASSGLGILGLTNNDYVNSQIVLPTFTTGTAVPNNSTTPSPNPLASQYTRTGVTPNQLYISNGTSWILQSINSNTEYAASDFDISNLGGDVDGYANSNVNQTFIQAAITDFSSFRTRVGAGVPITASLITGVGGTITSNFGWTSMGVSAGATAASFSTTDGTNYTSNNITGQLLATHPLDAVTSASQTYTWSRTGGNVSGFALSAGASGTTATSGWDWGTNTGGTDNTFGSAATFKTVYVKHIASGFIITMSCYIIDTSSSGGGGGGGGGCFLPGTVIELEDGLGLKIETIEPGQEVKGGTITKRESFEVDYWYYLNDLKITAGHPVWIIDKGWSCIDPAEYYREHQLFGHKIELEPKQIEIGDMTTNGSVDIINRIDKKQTVWNITVDDTHTYYVDGILVHNSKE